MLGASLVFAVILWGGNNVGTKWLVNWWPPSWTGGTRFLCAGLLLLGILRWTNWLGSCHRLTPALKRKLWFRGGLSLAAYIISFNWALKCTAASRVVLFLGMSPVWALLWEGVPGRSWRTAQRYAAAFLALSGVGVLVWPALHASNDRMNLYGDGLALLASVLWTNFSRQCRVLGADLSSAEVSAHAMWRAGMWLMPLAIFEFSQHHIPFDAKLLLVQFYCIVAGGVVAFGFWSNGLRHWPTSRVMLFNNLIPLSTMTWEYFCLGEAVTRSFWIAMFLIAAGVILGQTKLRRAGGSPALAQPEL